MEDKTLIEIGDLVQLKKDAVTNKHGYGVVLQKITSLFIFPEYINLLQIDYDKQYEYIKNGGEIKIQDPVDTRICKVYWIQLEKMEWEYECDLKHV